MSSSKTEMNQDALSHAPDSPSDPGTRALLGEVSQRSASPENWSLQLVRRPGAAVIGCPEASAAVWLRSSDLKMHPEMISCFHQQPRHVAAFDHKSTLARAAHVTGLQQHHEAD